MSAGDKQPAAGSASSRRAELKRAYRETPPAMGIYVVRNRVTGAVRTGWSLNLPGALNRTRFSLERHSHMHETLQAEWDAQGPEAFTLEILDVLEAPEDREANPREDLRALEALWLERLRAGGALAESLNPAA